MADTRLSTFVKESLVSGASRADTERVLIEAGWPKDQIASAIHEFSDVVFPVPVPRPVTHFSARDAFLYLVMFSMLYLSAYHLGNLVFQFINLAFPDPVIREFGNWADDRIRFSTSALIVSFPVFLYVSSIIAKHIQKDPTHRTSAIRKWLTYLTLAVAACIIVGDLIYLLNSLLSGELTVRFVLKALVVGFISGVVFTYYLWTMRMDEKVLSQ